MEWGTQQKEALTAVNKWILERKSKPTKQNQVFKLFGYAGTGKTTLAKHFAEGLNEVCFGAYTGKAALMLRKKGCTDARTIHSLIYIADRDQKTGEVKFHLNRNQSPLKSCDLIIIDECSMVDDDIGNDLRSFGKPILVLGDPGQLPPIKGAGHFTSGEPDFMLTEIHRQAKDNPIIYLATQARMGIYPDYGNYGDSRVVSKITTQDLLEADQVLCGRNITRTSLNHKIRKLKGFSEISDMPVKGDKLVCLQNDKDIGIFNGGLFTVEEQLASKYKTNFIHLSVTSDDFDTNYPFILKVHKSFFLDDIPKPDWRILKGSQEVDFGYSLTGHKSQGSQWNNNLIYSEEYCFRDMWERWLYTVITRSSEKLTLFKN